MRASCVSPLYQSRFDEWPYIYAAIHSTNPVNGIDKLWTLEVEGSKWPKRHDHTYLNFQLPPLPHSPEWRTACACLLHPHCRRRLTLYLFWAGCELDNLSLFRKVNTMPARVSVSSSGLRRRSSSIAGLPISWTLGPCWEAVIIRSNFESDTVFRFLNPNYMGQST